MLSLPPIINSEHSKISKDTRNCFIECTAVDIAKAEIVLNTIVCLFSLHCEQPFTVEPVRVEYEEAPGRIAAGAHTYPDLSLRNTTTQVATINRVAGLDIVRLCAPAPSSPTRVPRWTHLPCLHTPPASRSPPSGTHLPPHCCLALPLPHLKSGCRRNHRVGHWPRGPRLGLLRVWKSNHAPPALVCGAHRTSAPFWGRTAPRAAGGGPALAWLALARAPFWSRAPRATPWSCQSGACALTTHATPPSITPTPFLLSTCT